MVLSFFSHKIVNILPIELTRGLLFKYSKKSFTLISYVILHTFPLCLTQELEFFLDSITHTPLWFYRFILLLRVEIEQSHRLEFVSPFTQPSPHRFATNAMKLKWKYPQCHVPYIPCCNLISTNTYLYSITYSLSLDRTFSARSGHLSSTFSVPSFISYNFEFVFTLKLKISFRCMHNVSPARIIILTNEMGPFLFRPNLHSTLYISNHFDWWFFPQMLSCIQQTRLCLIGCVCNLGDLKNRNESDSFSVSLEHSQICRTKSICLFMRP